MAKFIEVHPCPHHHDDDSVSGLFFAKKEAAELIRVETVKKAWIHILGKEEYFCIVHYYDECTKTERRAMFGENMNGFEPRKNWSYYAARNDFEMLKSILNGTDSDVIVNKCDGSYGDAKYELYRVGKKYEYLKKHVEFVENLLKEEGEEEND